MPAAVPIAPQHMPRRARYLIPRGSPRRREILAVLAIAGLAAGGLFAPLLLVLAAACHLTSKASRWRPAWLAVPAACGLVWVLAAGPGAALAGAGRGPHALISLIAHVARHPSALARAGRVPAVVLAGLPGQLPLALILAAALAAIAWWLDWLHTDEWNLPAPRPGLISVVRRRWNAASVKAGGVGTRHGASLGIDRGTGRLAVLTWEQAAGGVLVTGTVPAPVAAAGVQLVHAAIRRRQPVIAVDLVGCPALPDQLAGVCAAAGAPLTVFGAGGAGYEPLRGDPGRAAGLVAGMLDWGETAEPARRCCLAYLTEALTVLGARRGGGSGGVLAELIALLRPGALWAALDRVPAYDPGRDALADRVSRAENWLAGDQVTATLVASQLTALRATALGRWLAPAPAARPALSVDGVFAERGVALFALGTPGQRPASTMIANLVALDLAAWYAGQHEHGIAGDGVAWFHGCEAAAAPALAALLTASGRGRLACVLTTTSPEAAAQLAGQVSACVAYRLGDPALAGRLAALTGTRLRPAGLPVTGQALAGQALAGAPLAGQAVAAPWLAGGAGEATGMGMAAVPVISPGTLRGLADGEFVLMSGLTAGREGGLAGQPAHGVQVLRGVAVNGALPAPARGPR